MHKADIVVGGVYSDGKKGIRRVVDEGPQYKLYGSQETEDCLLYELLSGRRSDGERGKSEAGNPLYHCTRTAFAAWAKERIK